MQSNMMEKEGCSLSSLKMHEAKSTYTIDPTAAAGGIIEVRIRMRYQLWIKAKGIEKLVDDIFTPEFVTPFAMPSTFLLPQLSAMQVSNMLNSINVDAKVRDLVSPMIAKYAVDVAANRHRAGDRSGFMTVAQLSLKKIDYIGDAEFDRISKMITDEEAKQQTGKA